MDDNNMEEKPKYKYDPYTGEYLGGGEENGVDAKENDVARENFAEGEKKPEGNDGNYFNYEQTGETNGMPQTFTSGSDHNSRINGQNGGESKTFGIISMVLGILSLLGTCCCGVSIIFGVVAIVLAAVQMKKGNNGFAVAGLIMGILGIIFGVLAIVIFALSGTLSFYDIPQYYPEFNEPV